MIIRYFFDEVNWHYAVLDEIIFREQFQQWQSIEYKTFIEEGPEKLPEELPHFPALLFQITALSLQNLPTAYNEELEELKFRPSQTYVELSKEYTECAVALTTLLGRSKPTLVGIQQAFLRCTWMLNTVGVAQAWQTMCQVTRLFSLTCQNPYNG
jgi:hypothetical protein